MPGNGTSEMEGLISTLCTTRLGGSAELMQFFHDFIHGTMKCYDDFCQQSIQINKADWSLNHNGKLGPGAAALMTSTADTVHIIENLLAAFVERIQVESQHVWNWDFRKEPHGIFHYHGFSSFGHYLERMLKDLEQSVEDIKFIITYPTSFDEESLHRAGFQDIFAERNTIFVLQNINITALAWREIFCDMKDEPADWKCNSDCRQCAVAEDLLRRLYEEKHPGIFPGFDGDFTRMLR